MLPAQPGSGKTTLAAGLTHAGFAYLSDEAAPIDLRTRELVPYPRPLTMKPGTVAIIPGLTRRLASVLGDYEGPQYHVRPDDLRQGALGGPCRVGYVIAPRYEPEEPTSLEPMTRGEALVLLAENSFNFDRHGTRGLEVLRELVAGADCYRLRMGDLESAVRAITDVVHGGEK